MSHVVTGVNDIATCFPELLTQWDYSLNKDIQPECTSRGSQKQVWWKCISGHSYLLSPDQKTKGQGCPLCAGRRVVTGINDLTTMRPDFATEWDFSKNGSLSPETTYYKSTKRIYWKCKLGHTWQAILQSRVENNSSCPVCAGNKVWPGFNDLASCYPDVAVEWDWEKNSLTPTQVTKASSQSYWWKCKSCNYSWKTSVGNRTNKKSGCPKCTRYTHTSFPEQAIIFYLSKCYSIVENGYRDIFIQRMELDVYIPEIQVGIEYDGQVWHSGRNDRARAEKKYEICHTNGIKLIRISELPKANTEKICDLFILRDDLSEGGLNKAIITLMDTLGKPQINIDVENDRNSIMSQYLDVVEKKSLSFQYPELVSEWDFERNYPITPDKVNSTTNRKFWWKCSAGHSWQAAISNRSSLQTGCPYCSGKHLLSGVTDLETRYPVIASEWDQEKNAPIKAYEVMPGSIVKYWWKCPKGHSYLSSPNSRTASHNNCPICSGKKIIMGINSIFDCKPELKSFWSFTKNKEKNPGQYGLGSRVGAWWQCPQGHEWYESIVKVARRQNTCPVCTGALVIPGVNDLATTHPLIAAEWDSLKNECTSYQFSANCTKKVWWICNKCTQSWQARINIRTQVGTGCPSCGYTYKSKSARINTLINQGHSLSSLFPEIASEWDYRRNGNLTPESVTYGSNKKVWWICPKGHEYQCMVVDRTGKKKCGCSICRYDRARETMLKRKK